MSESAARIALGRTTSDAVANADVAASSSTSAIDPSPSPFRRLYRRGARWLGRSLGRRFVVGSLGLLLVVQLVSFLVIDASMERHARRALPEQLARGEQALNSIVDWRSQRLVEGARLLAADYGFRSAVQSGDRATIASTLSNHGARIGASEVALLGTDFAPVAIAEGSTWKVAGAAASVGQLASLAARQGGAGAITVIDGQARQMVLVPLRAPLLAGWVVMYFPLPAEVAEDVHKLSATDLTLLSRGSPEEKWSVDFSHASTAQAAELATLDWPTDPARTSAQPPMIERRIGAQTLGLHALPLLLGERLGDGRHAQVLAVLSLSIDESMRPPEDMKIALLVTTLLAFVAFGAGSWYNARRITTPLQALSGAAERLGSGDLATPIRSANTGDEVGELAAAIEHMRVRLAGNQEQMVLSEKLASIGQLAAGVAHEINNPIGFVFSNFGTLEEYLASLFRMLEAYRAAEPALAGNAAAGALARLREEIELDYLLSDIPALMSESRDGLKRVRKIVQDLKDFSHVDSREEWEIVDLHTGLDSTLNIVANEIKYKAEVVKAYGVLPRVECLPHELNQVFMNLLVNAAHAIGAERGVVTLRTFVAPDQSVCVEVADTGCGIAPQDLKRIFDPFFTTKEVGKGTGLGLSLSYGIVKKHGGRIEATSEVGKGTTFRVSLPVRRPAPAAAAAAS